MKKEFWDMPDGMNEDIKEWIDVINKELKE